MYESVCKYCVTWQMSILWVLISAEVLEAINSGQTDLTPLLSSQFSHSTMD